MKSFYKWVKDVYHGSLFSEAKSIPTGEIIAYHGDQERLNLGWRGLFFATSSKKLACYYGPWVHKISFSLDKPLIIDARGSEYSHIKERFSTDHLGSLAMKKDFDGVLFKNVVEGNYPESSTVYIVFETGGIRLLGTAKVHQNAPMGVKNRFVDWETDDYNSYEEHKNKGTLDVLALAYPGVPTKAF